MTINKKMKSLLGGRVNLEDFILGTQLRIELNRLIDEGFICINNSIIFKAFQSNAKKILPKSFPDLTGYESFINHIHVEDFLKNTDGNSPKNILKQGIGFVLKLEKKLKNLFPSRLFKIILSFNESGCNVRFHFIRKGESWLSDNIEDYTDEAILVIKIGVY